MYERDQLFIDGKWSAPDSEQPPSTVISPHSEEVIGRAVCAGPADVDRAVDAARTAFDTGPWPRMQPAERIEAINRLAGIYKETASRHGGADHGRDRRAHLLCQDARRSGFP